jgi:hypothetical protein
VPFLECLPELWVINDADQARAEGLIATLQAEPVGGENWRCAKCKEDNEAQFAACWNCGHSRSED